MDLGSVGSWYLDLEISRSGLGFELFGAVRFTPHFKKTLTAPVVAFSPNDGPAQSFRVLVSNSASCRFDYNFLFFKKEDFLPAGRGFIDFRNG